MADLMIAGLRLEDVSGTQTSCYIGTFTNDFVNLQAQSNEAPSIYRQYTDPPRHTHTRR